jgi:phytoene dehydrogenase-like protein
MQGARSHYDVIVLGAEIAALAAGALLARRGFRVAWVRHNAPTQSYTWGGHTLYRSRGAMPFLQTPAWSAIANELAIQTALRRITPVDECVTQVIMPRARLDIRTDEAEVLSEFAREFPELSRPIEEWFARVRELNVEMDRAFEPGVAWPPEGFFQRRATTKKLREIREFERWKERDLLGDFPDEHPFRVAIQSLARLHASADPDTLDALQLARAWGLAFRGMPEIEGGTDRLVELLAERITQFGGVLRERERVDQVLTDRGRVSGLRFAVTDEVIGCSSLITSLAPEALFSLARTEASAAMLTALADAEPTYARYCVNFVVRSDAIPIGLAKRAHIVLDASRPLSEENLLYLEHSPNQARDTTTVAVFALLPRAVVDEGPAYLVRVRRRLRATLQTILPFFDEALLAIDSPFDGLDLELPQQEMSERVEARWNGEAEPMPIVPRRVRHSFGEWCAVPLRGSIDNVYWLGPLVVPGLNTEGELLAAMHLVETLTQADPSKARLRREIWKKS